MYSLGLHLPEFSCFALFNLIVLMRIRKIKVDICAKQIKLNWLNLSVFNARGAGDRLLLGVYYPEQVLFFSRFGANLGEVSYKTKPNFEWCLGLEDTR